MGAGEVVKVVGKGLGEAAGAETVAAAVAAAEVAETPVKEGIVVTAVVGAGVIDDPDQLKDATGSSVFSGFNDLPAISTTGE